METDTAQACSGVKRTNNLRDSPAVDRGEKRVKDDSDNESTTLSTLSTMKQQEDEPVQQRTLCLKLTEGNTLDKLRQHAPTYIRAWQRHFGMVSYKSTADNESVKLTFKTVRNRNAFRKLTHMDGRKSKTLQATFSVSEPRRPHADIKATPSHYKMVAYGVHQTHSDEHILTAARAV